MGRWVKGIVGVGVSVAGLTGSSSAALISFASDTNPVAPTLVGAYDGGTNSTLVRDVSPTPVELLFDPDDDGPLGPISMDAHLTTSIQLSYAGSVQVFPGYFTHSFSALGWFQYDNAPGEDEFLIRGEFNLGEAAFIGLGTSGMIMSASITGFDINYTTVDISPAIFGVSLVDLPGDFGFTITNLNGGFGVQLARGGRGEVIGVHNFNAESSFSGSFVIPTPGALAIAGLAGLAASRRRRN